MHLCAINRTQSKNAINIIRKGLRVLTQTEVATKSTFYKFKSLITQTLDFTQYGSLSKLKKYYSFESENDIILSKVK